MNQINEPLVSVIIPLYVIGDRFFQDLKQFEKMEYSNFEVLVICDKKIKLPKIKQIRLIITGLKQTGPAEKRDIGLKFAKGSIWTGSNAS